MAINAIIQRFCSRLKRPHGLKHIVCVGFAKSGTTMLHEAFKITPGFQVPIKAKELRFFDAPYLDYADYLAHFALGNNYSTGSTKACIEFSPTYCTGATPEEIDRRLRDIKNTLPNSKILFCIRHPAYRVFSHYIHELHAFSAFGQGRYKAGDNFPTEVIDNAFELSLEEAISRSRNLATLYFEPIAHAFDIFGKDNVLFFFTEHDSRHFNEFFLHLCSSCLVEESQFWFDRQVPKANILKNVPTYEYGGTSGKRLVNGSDYLELKPKQLLILNRRQPLIIEEVDESEFEHLKYAEGLWTTKMSGPDFERLFKDYFLQDIEKVIDLLDSHKFKTDVLESYLNYDYHDKVFGSFDTSITPIHQPIIRRRKNY